MDLRTGRTYGSMAEARADGVPESDIVLVETREGKSPRVTFAKHKPFVSFKNAAIAQGDGDHGDD